MAFAYSNNGKSWRSVEPDWDLEDGEVLFLEEPTADQLAEKFPQYEASRIASIAIEMRAQRDTALAATDWLVQRHRDEIDMNGKTTLSSDQFKALLSYRDNLRNLPNQKGFPEISLPAEPL